MGEFSSKLIEWLPKLWRWLLTRRFRQVFGRDAANEFHVIYNVSIPPDSTVFSKPEPKVHRDNYRRTKGLGTVNSCATTRAIGHLVYGFGEMVSKPPIIRSDVDTDDKMSISFVSIGGVTNLKTCDVLRDSSNHFLDFDCGCEPSIISRSSRQPIVYASAAVAYGLIIKINPHSNPERTWICCAGFGEWGASGAAWFLATKWKSIRKWAKGRPFAIITETECGSDESTKLVHRFLTPDEVARAALIVTTTPQVSSTTGVISTTCTAAPGPMQ